MVLKARKEPIKRNLNKGYSMKKTLLTTLLIASTQVNADWFDWTGINSYEKPVIQAPAIASKCISCHGSQGLSNGMTPMIAGQSEEYLTFKMKQMKYGEVPSTMMAPVMAYVSDNDIKLLAKYYASQDPYDYKEFGDKVEQEAKNLIK